MKSSFIVLAIATILTLSRAITRAADVSTPLRDLGEPKRTQIVATLDTKIEDGKNAVWCASFVAAWKHLQNDLAGGMVELDGARETWLKLNQAPDPVRDVPPAGLYATAGFERDGIRETILKAVAARFPNSEPPKLPPPALDRLIAYARLEVSARFPVPYGQNALLVWSDATGRKYYANSFGISQSDDDAARRSQPRVFYFHQTSRAGINEFVLNLNAESQQTQVFIAQIQRKATLAETLRDMVGRCAEQREDMGSRGRSLEEESTLRVPEMAFRLQHSFADLEGAKFASGPLRNWMIDVARQDISLRLDRNGAEVKSEAMIGAFGGGQKAPAYEVSGPFLFTLWQRGADNPFLVVWVDNDELLMPFRTNPTP